MEKMQESINKDLEELKSKHTETNNTITEMKNTLEGINSKISEAEKWISELEDKMVEITSEEQNKIKEWKELRTVSETSGTISKAPTFELEGSRKKKRKRKGMRKFLKRFSWKFPQHGKGNKSIKERKSHLSPRGTESPIQD